MTIETLTADDIAFLRSLDDCGAAKALRIIDAHAADRAALVERAERAEASAKNERAAALSNGQDWALWERKAGELAAEVREADAEVDLWKKKTLQQKSRADRAESERNALAATLERVRAVLETEPYPLEAQRLASALERALAGAPAPKLDGDQLVKALCDLAFSNGWILTYKLDRIAGAPAPEGNEK